MSEERLDDSLKPFVLLEPLRSEENAPSEGPVVFNETRKLEEHFACSICGKTFSYRSSKLDHERSAHSIAKPFKCTTCGKCFKYKRNLNLHERIKDHTTNNGKFIECQLEPSKNDRTETATEPEIEETSNTDRERPYGCSVCGKAFLCKSTKLSHERNVHTSAKPFECIECGKTYKYKYNLKIHQKTAHTERTPIQSEQFKCELCGQTFKYKYNLPRHMKDVHGQ